MENKKNINLLLGCCICLLIITPLAGISQEKKLISFEIEDQFKRKYTDNSWQGDILILLGSDKAGSKYNPVWAKKIYDSLETMNLIVPVEQVGLANLKSVPFLLRGFIRNKFPNEKDKWILMDWKGVFSKTYDFVAEQCNILIFDPQQNLVYQTSVKELNNLKIREILETLDNLNK